MAQISRKLSASEQACSEDILITGLFSLKFPQQPDYHTLDAAVLRVDGAEIFVCRLKSYSVGFFVKFFQGYLSCLYRSDDQLTVIRYRSVATDNIVAVVNIIVDHTVALDLKRKDVCGSELVWY